MSDGGMVSSQDRGAELERIIATHVAAQGCCVARNVRLSGRSGAIHEIDVLAEKADAVTSYRLAVDCKAWNQPIEKDVVYKLAGVMADVGLAKGIIASLNGYRVGAEIVAKQHAIELWGPKELAKITPEVGQEVALGPRLAPAVGCRVSRAAAHDAIMRQITPVEYRRFRKPIVFPPREAVAWLGFMWFPMWVFRITTTNYGGRTTSYYSYEALDGLFFYRDFKRPPFVENVDVSSGFVDFRVRERDIKGEISEAHQRWAQVTTRAATERYQSRLEALGFSPVPSSIEFEAEKGFLFPTWLGIFRDGVTSGRSLSTV